MKLRAYFYLAIVGLGCLSLLGTATAAETLPKTVEEFCDKVAAEAEDPENTAPGVRSVDIDVGVAVPVCREAMERNPGVLRFKYQYARALNVAGRPKEAFPLMLEAAKDGYAVAQYSVASLGKAGIAVDGKVPDPRYWLTKAAEQGMPRAQADLGAGYMRGTYGRPDKEYGYRLIEAAAASGNLYARTELARTNLAFAASLREANDALKMLEEVAADGDTRAMRLLAVSHAEGGIPPAKPTIAADWYERAAELDDGNAQFELAEIYRKGAGREINEKKATYWYRRAARNGNIKALLHMRKVEDADQ